MAETASDVEPMAERRRFKQTCHATNRQGAPCGRPVVPGLSVCRYHGGATPVAKAAAARRLARERLDGDLGALLADLEMDAAQKHPSEVLLDAVYRTSAMVQVLGAMVGGLEPSGRVESWSVEQGEAGPQAMSGVAGLYGPNHHGDSAPHVLVSMYAEWLDRAGRASKLALDAGVTERLVRLEEARGRMIADMLDRMFTDPELGLTPEQGVRARVVAARHMRALGAGPGAAGEGA